MTSPSALSVPGFDPRQVPVVGVDEHLPAVAPERLTPAALRQRFASPPIWEPEVRREPRFTDRAPAVAAVLVPLVQRAQGLTVLLTERTANLSTHSGQVAFPGGKVDPTDASVTDAALREADEEVALAREFVDVIGQLIQALQRERGASGIYLASQGQRFADTRHTLIHDARRVEVRLRTVLSTHAEPAQGATAKSLSLMAWALLGLDAGFFDRSRSGELISRLTADAELLRSVVGARCSSRARSSSVGQVSWPTQPRSRRRRRAVQPSGFLYLRNTDCGASRKKSFSVSASCTTGAASSRASKRSAVAPASKRRCSLNISVYSAACAGRAKPNSAARSGMRRPISQLARP